MLTPKCVLRLCSLPANAIHLSVVRSNWSASIKAFVLAIFFVGGLSVSAQSQRVLGIDVSAWQTNITQADWATFKRATNQTLNGVPGDGRDFVFIRSSRGGTTGVDQQRGGYPAGSVLFTNSQRYDDPYFMQNITWATEAGLLAGPYHFARPDVIASTPNTGGIANTGMDEANHFIQMAGAWMRPGYLLPVFDLEAGNPQRTRDALAQFCIDFSDRIYAVKGIRPFMYINGSYSSYLQGATNPARLVVAFPKLWDARYSSNDDPTSTLYWTGHPKDTAGTFYGPWDDAPNPTHPWSFWQYGSQGRLYGNKNRTANTDMNVAQGGMEFVKDHLVPALWMNDSNGSWETLQNWNSGETPVAPIESPGQLPRYNNFPLTLPTPRLPSDMDTVIIDRPATNITVTLSSGDYSIRKLYVRETLNIAGGSLVVNYVPSWDSTPISAQFSAPVTLANAILGVHTLLVDPGSTFAIGGANLMFNTIFLSKDSNSPAKLNVTGDVNLSQFDNPITRIVNSTNAGNSGVIDLTVGNRTFNVGGATDLSIEVPVTNGALTKVSGGTIRLYAASTYAGGTTVSAGTLLVNNQSGSGTGSGNVTVEDATLGGTGIIAGVVTVANIGKLSPGIDGIGTLTLGSSPVLHGTTLMQIDRNSGFPLADKVALPDGTLTYGGTLVVSNIGQTLLRGDVFKLFSANAYSGAFTSIQLPVLAPGLTWYTGNLLVDGTVKVHATTEAWFMSKPTSSGGTLTLHLQGQPNATYFVQRSTNLVNWDTISTNVAPPPNGVFDQVDTFQDLGTRPPAAYYRLRWFE
jgi:autotransporter-associated beta strand protein